MNPVGIAKAAAGILASVGTTSVIGSVINQAKPTNLNKLQKFTFGFGKYVLAGIAADHAAKYITDQIDSSVETFTTTKSAVMETLSSVKESINDSE